MASDEAQPRPKKGKICALCEKERPAIKRSKSGELVCRKCFFQVFEDEIHHTIVTNSLFRKGEKVAIAASGGKDSTVLAEVLTILNKRHDYGLDLCLLSVDEGISGYRDDSLDTVKLNQQSYNIPLLVVSYEDLYGWSMDKIVETIGRKSNCTFCGVFRRQALERGAGLLGVDKIVTGHNADDVAETIIMNILRGDVARLSRCVHIETKTGEGGIPRVRPFKYTYEKEIVLYAHFKKLDFFSTECSYAPGSFRGYARTYLKELERVRPQVILDIITSGENITFTETTRMPVMKKCTRCGFLASMVVCKACKLLETLEKRRAKITLLSSQEEEESLDLQKNKRCESSFSKCSCSSSSSSGNVNEKKEEEVLCEKPLSSQEEKGGKSPPEISEQKDNLLVKKEPPPNPNLIASFDRLIGGLGSQHKEERNKTQNTEEEEET